MKKALYLLLITFAVSIFVPDVEAALTRSTPAANAPVKAAKKHRKHRKHHKRHHQKKHKIAAMFPAANQRIG
jgi:hypothetical protein